MVPGGCCCSRSTNVEKRLMFSASAGVNSYSDRGGIFEVPFVWDDDVCCCFKLAACCFFCSSISASDAAIAALSSSSSSSASGCFFDVPFVAAGFGCDCSCDCGT